MTDGCEMSWRSVTLSKHSQWLDTIALSLNPNVYSLWIINIQHLY